ncbi:Protein of unknown function [Sporobacter termitidis DSM 10068]|uniref:DUF2812 domain-containing protein n=1 Tax=Sporobacter termitidis DSM 10068 TaxID=1123282 RepID=A0A1M5Z1Q4_9FIRM|nr:DUF2812 domain-containing protein [Sporobacter termitidis]SHI18150.1 Protein of unknown function [Sporobacter termitidis DSM 10068]
MNRKYVIHPAEYAIGENEKLYADMAARGWLLENRGAYLSRFRKAAPEKLRYRLEPCSPDTPNGETELPEDQRALYEECGWRYVTGRVWIHVFSAPERSDIPELHTDPRQQAATLKGLRRQYYFSWIPAILFLLLYFSLRMVIIRSSVESAFAGLATAFKLTWFTHTASISLFAFAAFWSLYAALRGAVCIARLRRRLKRGAPIDHAPTKRHLPHRILSGILLACCAAGVVLSVVQWAQNEKYDMPYETGGPYLLLKDLGWNGERTQVFYSDTSSYVKTRRSLLAGQWYTYECVSTNDRNGGYVWMYQDIYELPSERLAAAIVPMLMNEAVFARSNYGFKRVDVPGLDIAYIGYMEYIAVKGNTAYFIKYSDQGTQADVLARLAEA